MATVLFNATDSRFENIAAPGLLCAFDFDGTIAPIVRDPNKVSVPVAISRRLAVLRQYAHVAVISGRSVDGVKRHVDFDPHYIVGNHGLEGLPGTPSSGEIWVPICAKWERVLTQSLSGTNEFDPRIWVENKGYSVSVHYRTVDDEARIKEALLRLFGQLVPEPRVVGGKCVFNLLPSTDMHKGKALVRLMEHCGAERAFYVGDDATDEDIFMLGLKNLMTVRIGRNEESSADRYLHHRLDMVHLLDELIKRLEAAELRSA